MDPNLRNAPQVGPGMFPVAQTHQGTGYDLQFGHIQGFQPHNKTTYVHGNIVGANTLFPNYQMIQGQGGSVITNMPSGNVNMGNILPVSSSSISASALPSMGTFVGGISPGGITMTHMMPQSGYKGGELWQTQPAQQPSPSVNVLPSFGHFLMHQQHKSPQQQQQQQQHQQQQAVQQNIFQQQQHPTIQTHSTIQDPQQFQRQHFPQAIFPNSSQTPSPFQGPIVQQHGNMGQFVQGNQIHGLITNLAVSQPHQQQAFTNLNMNFNTAGFNQFPGANIINCHNPVLQGGPIPSVNSVFTVASPSLHSQPLSQSSTHLPSLQSIAELGISDVVMSCSIATTSQQITNTTLSIITTTGANSNATVTALAHTGVAVSSSVPITSCLRPETKIKDNVESYSGKIPVHTSVIEQHPKVEKIPTSYSICVPAGWKRKIENDAIVYFSPSNKKLSSLGDISCYLTSEGTCKCGLVCPIYINKTFDFDINVSNSTSPSHDSEKSKGYCKHYKKTEITENEESVQAPDSQMALEEDSPEINLPASFPSSKSAITSPHKKESKGKKRRRASAQNPYEGLLVSQLLAQREKLKNSGDQHNAPSSKTGSSSPTSQDSNTSVNQQWMSRIAPHVKETASPTKNNTSHEPKNSSSLDNNNFKSSDQPISSSTNDADASLGLNRCSSVGTEDLLEDLPIAEQHFSSPTLSMGPFLGPAPNVSLGPGLLLDNTLGALGHVQTGFSGLQNFMSKNKLAEEKLLCPGDIKVKKEKKKETTVFESDTPPPNVDVSILKDHGRGPIPKVTMASSLMDNHSSYTNDKSLGFGTSVNIHMSNPSNTSTVCSMSKHSGVTMSTNFNDSGLIPELGPLINKKSLQSTMDTITSECLSKCVLDSKQLSSLSRLQSPDPSGLVWKLPSMAESQLITGLPDINPDMFTEDRCESFSPESGSESPVLTETLTPSSIVHHTADKCSEDQNEIAIIGIHTEDTGNSESSRELESHQTISNVLSVPLGTKKTASQLQDKGNLKLPQLGATGVNLIQKMLGQPTALNEFPASNLLSAAARAQMLQEQSFHNPMNVLLDQHPKNINVHVVGSGSTGNTLATDQVFKAATAVTANHASCNSNFDVKLLPNVSTVTRSNLYLTNNVGKQLPVSLSNPGLKVVVSSVTTQPVSMVAKSLPVTTHTQTPVIFPQKAISNTLNMNLQGSGVNLVPMVQGNDILTKMLQRPGLNQPSISILSPLSDDQPDAVQESLHVPTQVFSKSGPGSAENIPNQIVQTLATGNAQSLPNQMPALSFLATSTPSHSFLNIQNPIQNNSGSNMHPPQNVNAMPININTQQVFNTSLSNVSSCLPGGTQNAMPGMNISISVPAHVNNPVLNTILNDTHPLQQNMLGGVNILPGAGGNQMPSLAGCGDIGRNTLPTGHFSGLDPHMAHFQIKPEQNPQILENSNKLQQQVQTQNIMLTQNLPLLQVLGANANHASLSMNMKCNDNTGGEQQQDQINNLIGQLQSTMTSPMAMNAQQLWNNLTTGSNITAMQLQTLQLQQQLLQQIQQLQGMQHLMSQFSSVGNVQPPVLADGNINIGNINSVFGNSTQGQIGINNVPVIGHNNNSHKENMSANHSTNQAQMTPVPVNVNAVHSTNSSQSYIAVQQPPSAARVSENQMNAESIGLQVSNIEVLSQEADASHISEEVSSSSGYVMNRSSTEVSVETQAANQSQSIAEQDLESHPENINSCAAVDGSSSTSLRKLLTHSSTNSFGNHSRSVSESTSDCEQVSSTSAFVDVLEDHETTCNANLVDSSTTQSERCSPDSATVIETQASDIDTTEIVFGGVGQSRGSPLSLNVSSSTSNQSRGDGLSKREKKTPDEEDSRFLDWNVSSDQLSSERAEQAADALTINRSKKRLHTDHQPKKASKPDTSLVDSSEKKGKKKQFHVGDLVWGQIPGFPSWPGKVTEDDITEEKAVTEIKMVRVRWFGDHTFTDVEVDKLKTFTEGLESHQKAKKKYRKGRKINTNLETAIQEAVKELDSHITLPFQPASKGFAKKRKTRS